MRYILTAVSPRQHLFFFFKWSFSLGKGRVVWGGKDDSEFHILNHSYEIYEQA